ncbi:unnamed protein product [Rotaria magnacalcarata]
MVKKEQLDKTYIMPIVGLLGLMADLLILSLTKWVWLLYIALIEVVGDKAVGAASNAIYKASLNFWPGMVFLVLSILGIFPLLLMCYLDCSEKTTARMLPTVSNVKISARSETCST